MWLAGLCVIVESVVFLISKVKRDDISLPFILNYLSLLQYANFWLSVFETLYN